MPKVLKEGSQSSEGRGASSAGRAVVVAAVAAAAGSVTVYLYLRARSANPNAGCVRGGCLTFPVESNPRLATQLALDHVRARYEKSLASASSSPSSSPSNSTEVVGVSLGALVHFLRGDPSLVFEGKKVSNAHCHRLPLTYIQYIEDNFLPNTKKSVDSPSKSSTSSSAALTLAVERGMFQELVELDFGLRCLEKYRATPFNNNDRTHVNLLQQLWVAAGNSASTFQRISTQWTNFGFQGEDPATDLRGAGILGLRQLVHFAQTYPEALQDMMTYNKRTLAAKRDCWYLLAVVSLQMTAQLLLQKEQPLFLSHLELIYDSLTPIAANSGNLLRGSTAASGAVTAPGAVGAGGAGVVTRRAAAQKLGLSSLADPRLWQSVTQTGATAPGAKPAPGVYCGDAEAGMNALHHQLLLHFKACWERDEPHVMDYNTYTPQNVYATFFSASWRPADSTQKQPSQRGTSS